MRSDSHRIRNIMLGISLSINGRGIGKFRVVNTGDKDIQGFTKYEVYQGTDDEVVEAVWHRREQGASELTKRVMEEIDEDLLE